MAQHVPDSCFSQESPSTALHIFGFLTLRVTSNRLLKFALIFSSYSMLRYCCWVGVDSLRLILVLNRRMIIMGGIIEKMTNFIDHFLYSYFLIHLLSVIYFLLCR